MKLRSILILSNGKSPEIAERRIAGAKIVHRDPHAQRAQVVERSDRALGVRQQGGFGDFEFKPKRGEAGSVEGGDHG